RIYVDTQTIKPVMTGMPTAFELDRKISFLSRTLISRPNVEKVVHMVNMDSKTTDPKDHEAVVTSLMKGIKFETTNRDNLFTITYNNSDRKLAKDVVQSLLTIFVEGNLVSNESPALALRFIDEQIEGYEKKLTTGENALKAFKQKNIGLMPQQGGDYYAQVAKAAEDLNETRLELREAEHARDSIEQQVTGDEPVLLEIDVENPDSIVNTEIDSRIAELRKMRDTLSLNFTDQHPDIISTKRLIAQLKERKVKEAKLMESGGFGGFDDSGKNYSPMLQQLKLALTESEAKVASMRARVEEYTRRYNHLKSLSNSVPEVEAALAQLNRDYQVNKTNYQNLLERREAIKLSSGLESTIDLMSFKIIDPPTVPEIPAGPERGGFYSLVFVLALSVGIGIAFTISQIRPAFHSQNMLRDVTDMPVLGSIPMIWTIQEKSNRKKRMYGFGLSLLSLLSLYGALMVKMT
ncbi:MAG: chain length-determining protein, partial [Proteobacteria bacterium]|nr:chain length-determining protein [Pseudomonadota bacterium]